MARAKFIGLDDLLLLLLIGALQIDEWLLYSMPGYTPQNGSM
jgi:hypothetical protein